MFSLEFLASPTGRASSIHSEYIYTTMFFDVTNDLHTIYVGSTFLCVHHNTVIALFHNFTAYLYHVTASQSSLLLLSHIHQTFIDELRKHVIQVTSDDPAPQGTENRRPDYGVETSDDSFK